MSQLQVKSSYTKKCVAVLGVDADDLKIVAICMNDIVGLPSTEVLILRHRGEG